MSAPRGRAILGFLAACAAAYWVWERPAPERVVLPAVEADAFASLAGGSVSSAAQLWERLRAMGVEAVILSEDSAADLAARGEVVFFSRAETEKLKILGLVASGAGPKPDSIWIKDPKAALRLSSALASQGVKISTSASGRSYELPPGVNLADLSAGFEPDSVAVLSAAGLLPVARAPGAGVTISRQRFWVRALPVSARESELLRAVYGRCHRLLILHPRPGADLEGTLRDLRGAISVVKRAGLAGVSAAGPRTGEFDPGRVDVMLVLYFAVGLIGLLLAVRVGLRVHREVAAWIGARAPIAAPVPEIAAGLASVWAAASAAGVLAAALPAHGAREEYAGAWTLWTVSAPVVVAAAALFAGEGRVWIQRWRSPLRVGDLAAATVAVLALGALMAPRSVVGIASLWEAVDRVWSASAWMWWWPWRWREIFVGVPSLVLAFLLLDAREPRGSPRAPTLLADPRVWLLFGLFAPAQTLASAGAGGVPGSLALAHGAAAFVLGSAVGLALSFLRSQIDRWVQSLMDPGLLT